VAGVPPVSQKVAAPIRPPLQRSVDVPYPRGRRFSHIRSSSHIADAKKIQALIKKKSMAKFRKPITMGGQ